MAITKYGAILSNSCSTTFNVRSIKSKFKTQNLKPLLSVSCLAYLLFYSNIPRLSFLPFLKTSFLILLHFSLLSENSRENQLSSDRTGTPHKMIPSMPLSHVKKIAGNSTQTIIVVTYLPIYQCTHVSCYLHIASPSLLRKIRHRTL